MREGAGDLLLRAGEALEDGDVRTAVAGEVGGEEEGGKGGIVEGEGGIGVAEVERDTGGAKFVEGDGAAVLGTDEEDEPSVLDDGLTVLGDSGRAGKVRACATTFDWDPSRADEWEAFACPNGDSTPLRPVRPRSCDDPQCPVCMPERLAADWNSRIGRRAQPEGLTIAILRSTTGSDGLLDTDYLKGVRERFREYRRARAIAGGFYGLTLEKEGSRWRAVLRVAVSDDDAVALTNGRAFTVEILCRGATGADLLAVWRAAYLREATAWSTVEELQAFRALTHGRRKFQGFGSHFGAGGSEAESADASGPIAEPGQRPLHRLAGGSGKAARTPPCCPRCGARLRGVGRFDPARMEAVAAPDGLLEWRWRERRAA